ncbi:MAG: type 4a pilus biogenesis protein PilO, partial [Candidatus Omnitrophica bacterium]|nr:type 4a pilus biogenesis protein PilO [Candidatus Omnitrophota bacterium]
EEIPILINARSGYHELGKLLSNMENADRFMKVSDIQIKSNSQLPRKHEVEILVLTYVLLATR